MQEDRFDRLVGFIDQWCWLTEEAVRDSDVGHVERGLAVSFLVGNDWERLPMEWRQYFATIEDVELFCNALYVKRELPGAAPDSLIEFLETIRALRVSREFVDVDERKLVKKDLPIALFNGMGDKKVVEVQLLSHLVARVAKDMGCSRVVDVGAGHGYLARYLSMVHGLCVIGVDCEDFHAKSAQRKTEQVKQQLQQQSERKKKQQQQQQKKKKKSSSDSLTEQMGNVEFAVQRIGMDTGVDEIAHIVTRGQEGGDDVSNWMLVGLHTCGDLFVALLKASFRMRCFVGVGCCYWKHVCGNTSNAASTNHLSYFVSKYCLDGQKNGKFRIRLSDGSLMAACHSVGRDGGSSKMSVLRCMLSVWAKEKCNMSDLSFKVGSLPKKASVSFASYVECAAQKLQMPQLQPEDKASLDDFEKLHLEEATRKVSIFWALKNVFGVAVESLVVMDRMIYVKENGRHCKVQPIFDPKTSTRNLAFVVT